jgi:hypothetical protein
VIPYVRLAIAAGALLHTTGRVFQQWAAGDRRMHPAFWELLQIKLSRLPTRAP